MNNKQLLKKMVDDTEHHPYYCSDTNYFSQHVGNVYESLQDFLDDYEDDDVDLNLIFRWDIRKDDDGDGYYAEVFIIHQRLGMFEPFIIENITEKDIDRFYNLLKKHWKTLKEMWKPINKEE